MVLAQLKDMIKKLFVYAGAGALFLSLLIACGNKGPLYIPEPSEPESAPATISSGQTPPADTTEPSAQD